MRVPDFSPTDRLLMSDVQFLMPSSSLSSMEINGIKVIQVPFSTYSRANPVYVYFQLYNLVRNNDGQTHFITDYILTPIDASQGEEGVLLQKLDRSGREELSAEFAELDMRSIKPGRYTLSVRATDRYRVQTIQRFRMIELVE